MELEGFSRFVLEHEGRQRDIYRRGEGPGVVVMHEVPGITPEVARFARTVADRGFTVFMPHLFGTPGAPRSPLNTARELSRACVSREFSVWAANRSSPIIAWLRALCRLAHEECGGPGVGAIGMCITGNFALALMVEPALMAPVLSQPSLPFRVGPLASGLHVSPDELTAVRRRASEGCTVLGMRFTHDFMCPKARFDALRRELGEGFEAIEIDSSPGNRHGIPLKAHSVVTNDLVDEDGHPTRQALDRVLAFFAERLVSQAP